MFPSTLAGRLARVALVVAVTAALAPPTLTSTSAPASAVTAPVLGGDVSWPNCPKGMGIPKRRSEGKPMPLRRAKYVVIGLTNGPGFFPNPCIHRQVRWARKRHLYTGAYAMTTYPYRKQLKRHGQTGPFDPSTRLGRLKNAGRAQAKYNIATMEKVGLESPIVWVDVEPYPVAPWSGSIARNQAVVRGAVSGYRAAGYKVGIYSTQSLWAQVVGKLRFGYPEWRTAGQTTMSAALYKCRSYQIQGGRAVMAQWWDRMRDHGVMCPGYRRPAVMRRYFHKY